VTESGTFLSWTTGAVAAAGASTGSLEDLGSQCCGVGTTVLTPGSRGFGAEGSLPGSLLALRRQPPRRAVSIAAGQFGDGRSGSGARGSSYAAVLFSGLRRRRHGGSGSSQGPLARPYAGDRLDSVRECHPSGKSWTIRNRSMRKPWPTACASRRTRGDGPRGSRST